MPGVQDMLVGALSSGSGESTLLDEYAAETQRQADARKRIDDARRRFISNSGGGWGGGQVSEIVFDRDYRPGMEAEEKKKQAEFTARMGSQNRGRASTILLGKRQDEGSTAVASRKLLGF